MSTMRVLLADDHALVCAGFRALLQELRFEVVAEARNGEEALQLIAQYEPDVVLMDIAMPKLNGLEVTARVAREFPAVRVIILSMHANAEYVRRALSAGASGYLLKNASAGDLDLAIRSVAGGESHLSPAVAKYITADYARGARREAGSLDRLTPRQLEILTLLAKGYTRKQIAEQLTISAKTFDTYRAQVMEHLNIDDIAGLVRYATRMGLVTPEE